ncbi:SAF domain-containing protein [Amycolatopsis sp. PS_44_ISF1]|uniref:SAF domain-containing protein n=1 Tax=Amycolatopsis sp. PS_44_ISF1 TaxID=2974917 RepID=UPI0028DF8507|nr:SAF domain-containing protein [Amycolatopsis sp. PS_44_ISF1]MDT8911305.1 SAF domain-containing protein [Amycolatopsis sp. PS_44_ISF1]
MRGTIVETLLSRLPALPDLSRLRGRRARLVRRWLAAALLLAGLIVLIHPASARGTPGTATVVSARDLPAGATLRAADLRLADLPEPVRPQGALGSVETAVGRLLTGAARAGEPLTDARVLGIPGTGETGRASVPVRLADAGVADLLRSGQHVDVVAAPDALHPASVLAEDVAVVTVSRPEAGGGRAAGPSTQGPLVLLSLPVSVATQVAATSLERPVTVTLR